MFSVRTEWTNVAWRVMNKTMSDHLILPLETLSAFTSRASLYTAVVWPIRRVNIGMGVQEILGLCQISKQNTKSINLLESEMVVLYIQDMCIGSHQSGGL
jgi:hypothetical protein